MKRDPAFDRPASLLHGAQLAKVVAIDDPEGLNRVQVRLFAFDEHRCTGRTAVGPCRGPLCRQQPRHLLHARCR